MIQVIAKSKIKEGCLEEYKKVAFELIDETRKEEGVISYQLYQDIQNELIMTIIEVWKDEKALLEHSNTPHYKKLVPKFNQLREFVEVNAYRCVK